MKTSGVDTERLRRLVDNQRKRKQQEAALAQKFRILAPDISTEKEAQQYLDKAYAEYTGHIDRIGKQLLEEYHFYANGEGNFHGLSVPVRGFPMLTPEDLFAPIRMPDIFYELVSTVDLYIFLVSIIRQILNQMEMYNGSYVLAVQVLNASVYQAWPELLMMFRHHHTWAQHGKDAALYNTAAAVYVNSKSSLRIKKALQGTSFLTEMPAAVAMCLNEAEYGRQFEGIVTRVNNKIDKLCPEGQTENTLRDIEDVGDTDRFEQNLIADEWVTAVLRAAHLPAKEQAVIELFLEGLTESEVSDRLKRNIGTLRSEKDRARKKLRLAYDAEK